MSCPQDSDRYEALGTTEPTASPAPPEGVTLDPLASFTDVEQLVRALAYAELRAVMLAWARVPVRHPTELVRGAIDAIVSEVETPGCELPDGFGQRIRDAIRAETASALMEAIVKAGPMPWHRPLALGQLGDAAGLETVFHEAGELAGRVRGNDPRVLSAAVSLTDYVRSRGRARPAHRTTPA